MNFTKLKPEVPWLIDTNIIIYALDGLSPFYSQARALFEFIHTNPIPTIVSTQIITEVTSVLVKVYKKSPGEAAQIVEEFIAAFNISILAPLVSTPTVFFSLLQKFPHKHSIYDTFLAATMIDNDQLYLLTVNTKDFSLYDELKVVNPFV